MSRKPYYEPGRYWCKIVNQQLGKASTGNPQIVITFQVLGKVDLADPEGNLLRVNNDYERSYFRTITDKTAEWAVDDLHKLGFTGDSFGQLNLDHPNCCDLRGSEVSFTCAHEEDNRSDHRGEIKERWSVSGDGGTLKVAPLADKDVRKLDALFGKALKANKPVAIQPASAPAAETKTLAEEIEEAKTAAPADDGIPFSGGPSRGR